MLSVRRRDEGRKGLGLGFGGGERMEENELEEGEALSGQDDDASIDPDTALSYIDEKLQDVLGHFQKDFEGGVSAENLGAKFGGYGSFLPSYQRSPSVLLQPKSPLGPIHNASRSPYNSSIEGARQNPPVPTGTSVSKNSKVPALQSLDNSGKISANKSNAGEPVPQHAFINKAVNGSDQKTLKVRIKVGPDTSLTRNNAAIYSGLGLDSPCSSPEDSPYGSAELSPDPQCAPDDSPMTIVRIMTCFSVPGGYLLSPLPDSVLHLTEKDTAFLKACKTGFIQKGIQETCTVVADMVLPAKDVKSSIEKKVKPDEKSRRIIEARSSIGNTDTSTILKKEIDSETPEGQQLVNDALNISILSGSRSADLKVERQIVGDSLKTISRMPDLFGEPNSIPRKDRIPSPDLDQVHQLEFTESIKKNGICLENGTPYLKGKPNSKTSLEEKLLEERKTSNHKDTTCDIWREDVAKVEKSYDTAKSDSVGHKARKNHTSLPSEPPDLMSAQKAAPYNTPKSEYVGYKMRENHSSLSAEPPDLISAQRAALYEQEGERVSKGKERLSEGKRKLKESLTNVPSAVELTKETLLTVSSVTSKEKKKSSHGREIHTENKSKGLKSRKELSKSQNRESHRVTGGDVNAEQVQYRNDLLEINHRDKPKDSKLEQEKGSFPFSEKPSDRPRVKKVNDPPISRAFVDAPVNAPLMSKTPNSYVAGAPQVPVVIEENWVACDKCQEWRLLPYGTDPPHGDMKWQCSMQTWLPPGLNKCHISEAVTTKALNALYQIPVPESESNLNGHHEVAASTITSASLQHYDQNLGHNMQSVPTVVKKKHGSKDESNIPTSSKGRSISDVNEYPSETNASNRISLKHTSKSSDISTQKHHYKQKEKHKNLGRYSDGGDIIEENGKHTKSKSKREGEHDGFRSSKKSKKEGAIEDWCSNLDISRRDDLSTANGIPSKPTGKNPHNYGDYSSSKDSKYDKKGHLPVTSKRKTNEFPSVDLKEHFNASDVEKPVAVDFSAKKRRMKEWQASQGLQEGQVNSQHQSDDRFIVKENFNENEPRKQTKAKMAKSEGKEYGGTDNSCSTRVLLSGSKEHLSDGVDEARGLFGKEQLGKEQGSTVFHRAIDSTDYSKKDLGYSQPPAAATSSSSKVSSSRRSKANLQERRGSPVESVSSSPLRISNTENLSTRRKSAGKDDVTNVGFLVTYNENDGTNDISVKRRKEAATSIQQRSLESHRAVESRIPSSLSGSHDFHDTPQHNKYNREATDEDHMQDQDEMIDRLHANVPSQRKSEYLGKSSSLRHKEKHISSRSEVDKGKLKVSDFSREQKESNSTKNGSSCRSEADVDYHEELRGGYYDAQGKKDEKDQLGKKDTTGRCSTLANGPSMLPKQHKDFDSGVVGASCSKSNLQENLQQAPSHQDKVGRLETASGRGKSQSIPPSIDKEEVQTPIKGSRSEGCNTDAVNNDSSKTARKTRKPDNQNGARQAKLSCTDASSPIRKDGHAAAEIVLKEARDLKHTANRLKNEGLELESTGLYFESALKFLHGASLLEPPNLEDTKHGELNRSMKIYIDTAKFCQYCAHEYEKCKELAAAALAYKCVEVAYMKVAYYKQPSASKDRRELQEALKMAPPGESPSSSASDVDNLNNQGALDKAASSKGTVSPQIAGSHVIAARNRPNFMRLLDYTNDLNCALEATRKSQNAVAAAMVSLGKDRFDAISSVKKALDFNFQNVEGLLRLVRLSMEAISH